MPISKTQNKTTSKASVKTQKPSDIPEFIEGIPTKKSRIKERREKIKEYYEKLWRRLQRETGSNYIYNEVLQTNLYIIKNESDKKAKNESVYNWKSTFAVKHLYDVVKNARSKPNCDIEFVEVKEGSQKDNGYKQNIILYHKFTNSKFDYLNFAVKLTIGIKADGKHIQYAVNKIDIKK